MTTLIQPQTEERLRPFHWLITGLAGLAFISNGLTLGVLSFALPGLQAEWGLDASQLGLLVVVAGLGQMIGSILVGNVSDRLGRRIAFTATVAFSGLATGLAGWAPGLPWLMGILLCSGISFGGVAPVAMSLVGEFAPARVRGQLLACTQVFWVVGWCLAGLGGTLLIGQLGWRPVFSLGFLSLGLALLSARLVPESPRFLLAHDRREAAQALVSAIKERHGVHLDVPEQQQAHPRASFLEQLGEL